MTSEAKIDRIVEQNMADDVEREHGGDGEGTDAELSSEARQLSSAVVEIICFMDGIHAEWAEVVGITGVNPCQHEPTIHLHPEKFNELYGWREDVDVDPWPEQKKLCKSVIIGYVKVFALFDAEFQLVEE